MVSGYVALVSNAAFIPCPHTFANTSKAAASLQNCNPVVTMFCPASASNRLDIMKKTIAILALAAVGITTATAGVRFGINFGIPFPASVVVAPALVVVAPPMPAPIVEVTPVCPASGYVWVG